MTDPVRTIAERVRTRVLREGVDLAGDGAVAARYANEEVRRYSERALAGAPAQLGDDQGTARDVVASITGFGPLQPFFDDPEVEEIWINSQMGSCGQQSRGSARGIRQKFVNRSERRVEHAVRSRPGTVVSLRPGRALIPRHPHLVGNLCEHHGIGGEVGLDAEVGERRCIGSTDPMTAPSRVNIARLAPGNEDEHASPA